MAFCALLFFIAGNLNAQNADNSVWQSQNIYQIITDRFFNGDTTNDNTESNYNPSDMQSVHGGDFAGIQQKLDYLKALGITAIWISPIVQNTGGQFHGYAGYDFYTVAPHWGNLVALQNLVQAAHARGIKVVLDVVVNHAGDLVTGSGSGYPAYKAPPAGYPLSYRTSKKYPFPFATNATNPSLTNLFHNNGNIGDYNAFPEVQLGWLYGLNDFRTETPYIRSAMASIYQYWINTVGFDGFRVDTILEVEHGFWQSWCPAIHSYAGTNGNPNFFMFGEAFNGDESLVGQYTGTQAGGAYEMDSTLDYPLFFAMNNAFLYGGNTKQLEDHYDNLATYYNTNAQYREVTFLDNHDNARFLSNSGSSNRLAMALEFLYTSRGIPCLYYGTEQAFNGGTDPYDREDMFAGRFKDGPAGVDSFNMTHPIFQLVAKLNNFRRLYPALSLGVHNNLWNDPYGPGLFAYSRKLGAQEIFVALNTSSYTQTLPARPLSYSPGTYLVNLLDTNDVITMQPGNQTPSLDVPAFTTKIFIARNLQQALDPMVIGNSPFHFNTNVPVYSPIVLNFSKAMNTNSVQSAFTISPNAAGTFSWTSNNSVMTFTPNSPGLTPLTNYTVRLTNTAYDSLDGKHLNGAYELKFSTRVFSVSDTNPPTITLDFPTNGSTVSSLLFAQGSYGDDIEVTNVQMRIDDGDWTTVTFNSGTWSVFFDTDNYLNGHRTFSVRAIDSSGNSSTNSATLRFLNGPTYYGASISAGNSNGIGDCDFNYWNADQPYVSGNFGYVGGAPGYVGNTVSNVCPDAQLLYQRERFSTSTNGFYYQFDCPIGLYQIQLLEAETYWNAPSNRVFNIFIQGQQVKTNFDIFTAAGGANRPLTLTFTNTVTNSHLRITFTPVVDNARVSGIQVQKIAELYSSGDAIPDWWRLAYFDHAVASAADKSRATDDADGDGDNNLHEYLSFTDPGNSNSVFKILSLQYTNSTTQFSWPISVGHAYQVQSAPSLNPDSVWTNVGDLIVPSEAGTLSFTNPVSVTNKTQYYRVLLVQ